MYVNGGSAASANAANPIVADASLEAGRFGGAYNPNFLGADIGEVLAYHSGLSTAAAGSSKATSPAKRGLQTNLPAMHPSKVTCATNVTASLGLTLAVSPANAATLGTLRHTTTFTNGSGTMIYTPTINSDVPDNTLFRFGSATSALGSAGLTSTIRCSADGTTYTPTATDGGSGAPAGYDSSVKHIRWTLTGALGIASRVNPGSTSYAVRIE